MLRITQRKLQKGNRVTNVRRGGKKKKISQKTRKNKGRTYFLSVMDLNLKQICYLIAGLYKEIYLISLILNYFFCRKKTNPKSEGCCRFHKITRTAHEIKQL